MLQVGRSGTLMEQVKRKFGGGETVGQDLGAYDGKQRVEKGGRWF